MYYLPTYYTVIINKYAVMGLYVLIIDSQLLLMSQLQPAT